MVSANSNAGDPAKVKAILKWPELHTKTEVCSFLGLANYYCHFIAQFSSWTAPLHAVVHDSAPEHVVWTPDHAAAFANIKTKLTSSPVLCTYYPDLKCVVITDAYSHWCRTHAGWCQGQGYCPIEYYNWKMSPAETLYPTCEQELLAIKDAFAHWLHYLLPKNWMISPFTLTMSLWSIYRLRRSLKASICVGLISSSSLTLVMLSISQVPRTLWLTLFLSCLISLQLSGLSDHWWLCHTLWS